MEGEEECLWGSRVHSAFVSTQREEDERGARLKKEGGRGQEERPGRYKSYGRVDGLKRSEKRAGLIAKGESEKASSESFLDESRQ